MANLTINHLVYFLKHKILTCPACCTVLASESKLAGSAGKVNSTVRVSTAITPTGIPPRRPLPVEIKEYGSKE